MSRLANCFIDTGLILILILGIGLFRTPKRARIGNLAAVFALFGALLVVLWRNRIADLSVVVPAVTVSTLVSWLVASRVNMIQIPAMVAFQNGAGGGASFLVCYVNLTASSGDPMTTVMEVIGVLGLIVGAATFSASMVASGRLANVLRQAPTMLPRHNVVLGGVAAVIVAIGIVAGIAMGDQVPWCWLLAMSFASVVLGVVFSIRVGGADMPVLISLLNATTGLAAAFCGIVVQNRPLIACGATVAASGSILTHAMCRAMNRDIVQVLRGIRPAAPTGPPPEGKDAELSSKGEPISPPAARQVGRCEGADEADVFSRALAAARKAKCVIIIPGYGMALADAAEKVVQLARKLSEMNKDVKFAIHPVAGRMPGHMHVLLAEAEADFDKLFEMENINPEFINTDLALVVGACDVVNPAAIGEEGTPISGMPVLMAHESKQVVVCNLDRRPGYSGVPNPLYDSPNTILLFGDAKTTITRLLQSLDQV